MEILRFYQLPPNMDLKRLTQSTSSPTLSILTAIVVVCTITRLLTEFQQRRTRSLIDVATKSPIRIPYWVPFVGSAVSFARDVEGTLARDR
jgi:hypothetical protein